jgi:hypothetical protein
MTQRTTFIVGLALLLRVSAGFAEVPVVSLERPYTGEASYEAMKKVWPRNGGEWTALSPRDARTKFQAGATGIRTYQYAWPDDPGHVDLKIYKDDTMRVTYGAGEAPRMLESLPSDAISYRLIRGYLPGAETEWREGSLQYRQTTFARLLGSERVVTGKEPTIAYVQTRITNLSEEPTEAHLWVEMDTAKRLRLEETSILDEENRIRLVIDPSDQLDWTFTSRDKSPTKKDALRCTTRIEAGESTAVSLKIPCLPTSADEKTGIERIDVAAELERFLTEWEGELDRGMQIEVPEPVINDIYKSQLGRLLTSSQVNTPWKRTIYKTFPFNKYAIAHDVAALNALDQRGYHEMAGKYYEDTYLAWQGMLQPEGNFKSREGFLSGHPELEGDEWPVKNGFVLWAVCEHYKLSRDEAWLRKVVPNILASYEWIKRERAGTKRLDKQGNKYVGYGLLPPHRISDWETGQHGLWTDSWNHIALQNAAEVLAAIGHPRAEEVKNEADDYRQCVRTAVKRSIERAGDMTLPSGETIPYVPHAVNSRQPRNPTHASYGAEFGGWGEWCEYADCGPMWMVFGKIFDAREDPITWLQKFQEQQPVRLLHKGLPEYCTLVVHSVSFASPAGYSPEADAYFWRDEIEKYVEAFYSGLAAGCGWQTYIGRDHRAPYGSWYGPGPDGGRNFIYRRMLVQEDGEDLLLAWAVPRAWLEDGKKITVAEAPTYFGPMDYEIQSNVSQGHIQAVIIPPQRNPPPGMKLKIRFRHPQKANIQRVSIGGKPWHNHSGDTITIPASGQERVEVIAQYTKSP